LQISCEHADLSEAVRAAIEHEVERLEEYQHHITGCRVAVVAPSAKHHQGAVFRINIWVTIPPHENIVVSHEPNDDRGREHVLVSIKDAFGLRRELTGSTLPIIPQSDSRGGPFRGFTGSQLLRPVRLLAPLDGSDWDTAPATGRDRNTARATLGQGMAVSAFPRYVPV
jgi:hypothetical protein